MKPFLTNSRPTLIDSLPVKFGKLARLLTTKEQLGENVDEISDRNPLFNETKEESHEEVNFQKSYPFKKKAFLKIIILKYKRHLQMK